MHPGPPRRRRARPVADAPIDALLLATEDLAKGWLLALLEQAPLEEAPGILAGDLTRDGPRICGAVVRALADDADLKRIQPGGALEMLVSRTGELAGAQAPEETLRAVDALQAVIWSALREALSDPDPGQVSALAERLWLVIEVVRGAAMRARPERAAGGAPLLRVAETPVTAAPEEEGEEKAGDPLWMGALDEEIARSERTGAPLSLLLVELDEAERVLAVEPPTEASATFGRFAQAVRTAMRRHDVLACESQTRGWILARETGRGGGQSLAGRIARAVRGAPPWRGAPLTVSIGLAVLGEDGQDRQALIEAAEQAKYAAAASGVEFDFES
jgi:GGDEF domain-containing protein